MSQPSRRTNGAATQAAGASPMQAIITVESPDRRVAARRRRCAACSIWPPTKRRALAGRSSCRSTNGRGTSASSPGRPAAASPPSPGGSGRERGGPRPRLAARPLPPRRLPRSAVRQGRDRSAVGGRLLVAAGVAAAASRPVHRPAVPRHAGPAAGRGAGGTAPQPIVLDEYTSVVDRTVAQIGSAALAQTVRRTACASSP